MADEFDMYECIPQEQFLLQRLLALIRNRQNHCTDTECIDAVLPAIDSEDGNFTLMTMFLMFALVMYLIRPETLMQFTNTKDRTSERDRQNQPPPPSPPGIH